MRSEILPFVSMRRMGGCPETVPTNEPSGEKSR
jgi:hypothetical protein